MTFSEWTCIWADRCLKFFADEEVRRVRRVVCRLKNVKGFVMLDWSINCFSFVFSCLRLFSTKFAGLFQSFLTWEGKKCSVTKEATSPVFFPARVTYHKLNLMFGYLRSVSLGQDTSKDLLVLLGISNLRLLFIFWSEDSGEWVWRGEGNFNLKLFSSFCLLCKIFISKSPYLEDGYWWFNMDRPSLWIQI